MERTARQRSSFSTVTTVLRYRGPRGSSEEDSKTKNRRQNGERTTSELMFSVVLDSEHRTMIFRSDCDVVDRWIDGRAREGCMDRNERVLLSREVREARTVAVGSPGISQVVAKLTIRSGHVVSVRYVLPLMGTSYCYRFLPFEFATNCRDHLVFDGYANLR